MRKSRLFQKTTQQRVVAVGARFRTERKAGTGLRADVFLGKDDVTSRYVILKVFSDSSSNFPAHVREMFVQGARAQSRLAHPGIMPIIAVHDDGIRPLVVMPVAEACLSDLLTSGAMPEADALSMIISVCEAMEYVHAQGIYGGNIKPSNILLLDGRWVISDFTSGDNSYIADAASRGRSSVTMESVTYAAPERYDETRGVDARSDVLSIGRVLYYCLTGRPPFPRLLRQTSVPGRFLYVINRAVGHEPSARHQSVAEIRQELLLLSGQLAAGDTRLEEACELVGRSLEGDEDASRILGRLLAQHAHDEVFLSRLVPVLPVATLRSVQAHSAANFASIVTAFDARCGHLMPRDFAETAVNFFRKVAFLADVPHLRTTALRRIGLIVSTHELKSTDVLLKEMDSVLTEEEAALLTDVLRNHAECGSTGGRGPDVSSAGH
jgi:serine/threonine protein kinase